jgi:hypothetical protein
MDFIKRHPEHDQEWLTVQQGQLAVTPANIRAFLRSMQEEGVVSRAELTTMLDQLDDATWTNQGYGGTL